MKYHVRVPVANLDEVQNKDFLLGKKKLRPTVMVDLGVVEPDQDLNDLVSGALKNFKGLRKGKDTPRLVIRVDNKDLVSGVLECVKGVLDGGDPESSSRAVLVTVVLGPNLAMKKVLKSFDDLFSKHEGCVLALSQPSSLQGTKKLSDLCGQIPSLSVVTGKGGQVLTVGSVRSGLVGYAPEGVEVLPNSKQEGGLTLNFDDDQLTLVDAEVKVKAVKSTRSPGKSAGVTKRKAAPRKAKTLRTKGILISTVSR